ncbi:MAG: radical SAM protein [Bacteroidales bacterium]|nr:radical SAM protein [Bacteroidales bacterium]
MAELNSFVDYFRAKYGARMQKVVVDAGFTCPNRDGNKGTGGCSFCLNNAFHPNYCTPDKPIHQQIDEGIEFHRVRYRHAQRYIAYFQPYSNTYAPVERLKELYAEALSHPLIEGLVIGTRPDCIDEEKLDLLQSIQEGTFTTKTKRGGGFAPGLAEKERVEAFSANFAPGLAEKERVGAFSGIESTAAEEIVGKKIVIVEYGIESCYDRTLERIGRGHDFECARRAVDMTAKRGLTQCAHFIFGLPGESLREMMDEADIINTLPITSVKFHQLQIIKGTRMEEEYRTKRQDFHEFTLDGYLDFMAEFIPRLRSDIYIDRFASEVPPRYLSPLQKGWGLIRYQELLAMLRQRMSASDQTAP